MKPLPIEGCTRRMGAPGDWDHEKDGICHTLEILDVVDDRQTHWMLSAWLPSEKELELLKQGRPIFLYIQGSRHPVVSMEVKSDPKAPG